MITKINLTATNLLGVDRNTLLGCRFAAFVAPQDADQWYLFYSKILNHNTGQTIKLTMKRKEGTEFPVQLNCVVSGASDDNDSILCTLTDITQIKQAKNELNEATANIAISQAAYGYVRSLLEASLDPLVTINSLGKITDVNTATELITGVSRNNLMGSDFCNYFIEPDKARAGYQQVFQQGFVTNYPLSIRNVSGEVFDVLYNARVYRNINGEVIGVFAAARDITERKKIEEKAKEHLDKLAHVTRIGLIGEMASGIAHEVNQPLTAIASYAQLSLKLINTENPDLVRLAEILFKTQQQALRAGQLIHKMKLFGEHHSKQEVVTDINTLIHDATDFCMTEIKRNIITLNFELADNLPPVFVDHIQIEQVIINLIKNSIEALQDLPLTHHRQITLQSYVTPDNAIQISVKDNGLGINEEQQQKILLPFHTTKKRGTGMGLSISRSLIEAHGGTLHFTSQLGKGTSFYFTLPLIEKV